MDDPTYDRKAIEENKEWQLAFALSEIMNDGAPLGWGYYIFSAKCLLANFDIKKKEAKDITYQSIEVTL